MPHLYLKANALMKSNINTLLKARGQTRRDLAKWCRRSDAWIAKIMAEDTREFPMKYFDRIADFFGIATYQLLQPGISPLTERRTGLDRRRVQDRRISQAVLTDRRGDVDVMQLIRALSQNGRERAVGILADILNDEIRPPRATPVSPGGRGRSDETAAPTRAQGRGKSLKNA